MDDPGPANLEAMMATIDLSSKKWKVQAGPVNLQARIASISDPGDEWDVLDVPPWVHFFEEHKAQMAANIFYGDTSARRTTWRMRLDPYIVQWDRISSSTLPTAKGTVNAPNICHSGVGATWSGAVNEKILIRRSFTKSCGQDF
jgi:hypothetical protein